MSGRTLVLVGVALGAVGLWLASMALNEPPARPVAPAPVKRDALALEPDDTPDAGPAPRIEEAPSRSASARPQRTAAAEVARREYTVQLDELSAFCWGDPQHASQAYADEPIEMFAIRIPTTTNASVAFDFCVRELRFGAAVMHWGKAGRVEGTSNALGLEGEWLTFSDPVTHWERPAHTGPFLDATRPGEPLCIKGTAPQVFEGHYGDYWGAAVGFRFRRQDAARSATYRPHFANIRVVLEGAAIPNVLVLAVDRHPFEEGNESWCKFLR